MVEEKNVVNDALEGIFYNDNDKSREELKKDFESAGEDQVILSLNKSYELSGNKKMNLIFHAILAAVTLLSATITLALSSFMNDNLYCLFGILSEIGGLGMLTMGYLNYIKINDIADYTKEAELYILDVKPKAMKDLLKEKYKNTTGARIKRLLHGNRNKKKEEE
jgi:hypothetical protein